MNPIKGYGNVEGSRSEFKGDDQKAKKSDVTGKIAKEQFDKGEYKEIPDLKRKDTFKQLEGYAYQEGARLGKKEKQREDEIKEQISTKKKGLSSQGDVKNYSNL